MREARQLWSVWPTRFWSKSRDLMQRIVWCLRKTKRYVHFFLFFTLENDPNLFWVCLPFWIFVLKKIMKRASISILVPGARNPRYAHCLNKILNPGCKSLYKHAGWVVFEYKEEETNLKSSDKGKEDHSHSQPIKLNYFTVSLAWGHEKGGSSSNLNIAIEAL